MGLRVQYLPRIELLTEYPSFLGGTYGSQAFTADQERTVNLYPEPMEVPGATTRIALYPTPGVQTLANLSDVVAGGGRAHYYDGAIRVPGSTDAEGREFAVIGLNFLEIFENATVNSLGAVANDGLPATISSNGDGGDEIFVTSGGNGYIFNKTTSVFTQITALNGKASFGAFLDGYFLALDTDSSTLYISNLLDGLTWNTGTDFAQRSLAPDPWVSMAVLNRYIYLFGALTSEVWYNVAATFPFAPHPSGLLQYGCLAPYSPKVCDNYLCWLGSSVSGVNVALRATGFTPEVISTFAFQTALATYINPNKPTFSVTVDAQGDTYAELGHTFWVLSFPAIQTASVSVARTGGGHTWVYDLNTGYWHERGCWDPDTNDYIDWLPRWTCQAFGQVRTLNSLRPFIYRLTTESTTDANLPASENDPPKLAIPIRRLRRAPALMDEDERVYFSSFQLDLEPGLGDHTTQGTIPKVMMRQSKDGGKTWGSERWVSAGKQGEYGYRTIWRRCGMGRRMTFEVAFSDPIPFRITNAYLKLGQQAQIGRQRSVA